MTTRRSFLKKLSLTAAGAYSLTRVNANEPWQEAPTAYTPKISIFSKNLQWLNYNQMAVTAREIGFEGIDLTVRPNGHVLPERVAIDLPVAVAAIRKAGLEVYTITTAITEAADRYTEDILSVMRDLDIRHYRLNWFGYDEIASMEENLSRMKSRMEKLANVNEKYRIHGAYQNHSGASFGSSVWDLWEVLKEINPQYLGCQFDVRHAMVEGGNSWVNDFKIIQPYIKSHNIKDFVWAKKGDKWEAQSVPLGEGMVDFKKYFELVKLHNIHGPLGLHFEYPLGGADQGAKTLTIPKEKVIEAMQKDLLQLREWLK
jgi:L-ribulose-5-phosphate 3-epimerase